MKVFDLQLKMLQFCGIIRFSSTSQKVLAGIFMTWMYIASFYYILSAFFYAIASDDILDITESLAPVSSGFYTIVKFTIFLIYRDQFFDVIDEIVKLNRKWSRKASHDEKFQEKNKLTKLITYSISTACTMAGINYIMKPVLFAILNYFFINGQLQFELPFKAKLFNDSVSTFIINYFIQACYAYFVVTVTMTTGSIFSCFSLNIAAHFDILREIVDTSELEDFVIYHRQIINLKEKLNKLYKPIIFTEFVFTQFILCVTGFQVIIADNFDQIFLALMHGTAALIDVAIYSYGGQKVLDSALGIYNNAYKIDKKTLLVIMMTQKAQQFDAGFFNASLDTLSVMLSRTMSLITLLKSFVD